MKKVLIITYYWPPSGGAGVQRWLKFVKYIREFGWEPVIYTPENGEFPVIDHSLQKDVPQGIEVIRRPIWEPYSIYKKFVGQKKTERINTGFLTESRKPKLTEKLSVWLRGNLFIPDARKFWIKPSVAFLSDYLLKNPVNAIISTGPPHSMHLIALELRKKLSIPWVADFRDPWTNIDYYESLLLTSWANRIHHKLEHEVLASADKVISIGRVMSEEFKAILNRKDQDEKFVVIPNGYDEQDLITEPVQMDSFLSIAHIGTLVKSRNPEVLWKALSELIKTQPEIGKDFKVKLVGKIDLFVRDQIKAYGLENLIRHIDYLPHDEVVREQRKSQVLLLIINNTKNAKGILTGKFFEYLAASRPVLCIGPQDGEAADVIRETQCGEVIDYDNVEKMKEYLLHLYSLYRQNNLVTSAENIKHYSRRALTQKLTFYLDSLTD